MRQLHCGECGAKREPGRRQTFAGTPCEPAEWERVVYGRARVPTPEQKVTKVNGQRVQGSTDVWECDACGDDIKPNDMAVAWTVWTAKQAEPRAWEDEYLHPPEWWSQCNGCGALFTHELPESMMASHACECGGTLVAIDGPPAGPVHEDA